MSAYFRISTGLRGCYTPDTTSYVVRVETYLELKGVLIDACDLLRDDYVGGSKKMIAACASAAWRMRKKSIVGYMIAMAKRRSGGHELVYSYGVFCASVTREKYLAYCEVEGINS
jgi:hypothetical protein